MGFNIYTVRGTKPNPEMYLPLSQANQIEKLPRTPTTSSVGGVRNSTPIIPLDDAITQKFSDVVYALNLKHAKNSGSFLTPGAPPPSPATPGPSTSRFLNRYIHNQSKLVDYKSSPPGSAKNDINLPIDAETNQQQNNYDINDPLEKLDANLQVSVEDLNNVLDENGEYCNKIYNSNPWFQYILLGDEGQDSEHKENVPDATINPGRDDLDLQQFLDSLNHPPVFDLEEIKALLGIDLSIPSESGYFECGGCFQKFQTREEILQHKETEKDCQSNLIGTVVGFDLGQ